MQDKFDWEVRRMSYYCLLTFFFVKRVKRGLARDVSDELHTNLDTTRLLK